MRTTPTSKWKHPWGLRLAAILLGLLPILFFEVSLRWLGLPTRPPPIDPYVDLHNLRPLFEFNPKTGQMEIGAERWNLFRPATFKGDKSPDTFRIFALGGSTTQGEPYSTETAFPEWLKLNLQAAETNGNIEVINCGGLSYASYRVLAILREVLQYGPDLVVVYTGQNEYLEHRTYEGYRDRGFANRSRGWLSGLRVVQLARSLAGQKSGRDEATLGRRTELATEVEALLDYQGGLSDYRRGDAWYGPVPAHFRWNLEQMVDECRSAGVPLILMRPVTNLLDCPPIKFEVDPTLSPSDVAEFELHWDAARESAERPNIALEHLQLALAIDPEHAGANFLLGRIQFETNDIEAARVGLIRARDFDVCPLRATSAIADAVTTVAATEEVPLLDAEEVFASRSEHGIVGGRWLVDHIHPSIEGHQVLGEELARLCFDRGLVEPPAADWELRRKELYARQIGGLSEAYFHRGKQRLAGLLLWTQGRAKKVRNP